MAAYKAAVKALDGPDCSVALNMAREARSKLGDSAEVSWESIWEGALALGDSSVRIVHRW